MTPIRNFLPVTLGLAIFLLGGVAQAELVAYQFTVTIDADTDTNNTLVLAMNDEVTGTFSYDTDTGAFFTYTAPKSGSEKFQYSKYGPEAGSLQVDGVNLIGEGSEPASVFVRDKEESNGTLDDAFEIRDFGASIEGGAAMQVGHYLSLWGGDPLDGSLLPDSLSLAAFSHSEYYLYGTDPATGHHVRVSGEVTGLRQVSASSVPELSAQGTSASMVLLAGAALVLSSRRRSVPLVRTHDR